MGSFLGKQKGTIARRRRKRLTFVVKFLKSVQSFNQQLPKLTGKIINTMHKMDVAKGVGQRRRRRQFYKVRNHRK